MDGMKEKPGNLFPNLNSKSSGLNTKTFKIPDIAEKWVEKGNLKYLNLSSRGLFNLRWIHSLKGVNLDREARFFLVSQVFEARPEANFKLVFVDGSLFSAHERTLEKAREFAKKNGLYLATPRSFPALCELFLHRVKEIKRPCRLMLVSEPLQSEKDEPILMTMDLLEGATFIGHHQCYWDKHLHADNVYFIFSSREEEEF